MKIRPPRAFIESVSTWEIKKSILMYLRKRCLEHGRREEGTLWEVVDRDFVEVVDLESIPT